MKQWDRSLIGLLSLCSSLVLKKGWGNYSKQKGSNVSLLALTEEMYKGFPIRIQTFLTCVCISVRMDSFTECCLGVNFGRHFSFSLYLETKMLNSLSHILVFHSFSLVLVDEKSLHFCQLLVKLLLPTFILVAILHVVFKQNSHQFFSL